MGEVSLCRKIELLQRADCLLSPILWEEGFGLQFIEAMACGKPVISTALPTGVREVNEKDVSGLEVAPGDVGELRIAMERLAGDRELRGRMGAAGRSRVEDRFTLDRMVDAHLELCRELVAD